MRMHPAVLLHPPPIPLAMSACRGLCPPQLVLLKVQMGKAGPLDLFCPPTDLAGSSFMSVPQEWR